MMDETQAQEVLAGAAAPPRAKPGQLTDPPDVARRASQRWAGAPVRRGSPSTATSNLRPLSGVPKRRSEENQALNGP